MSFSVQTVKISWAERERERAREREREREIERERENQTPKELVMSRNSVPSYCDISLVVFASGKKPSIHKGKICSMLTRPNSPNARFITLSTPNSPFPLQSPKWHLHIESCFALFLSLSLSHFPFISGNIKGAVVPFEVQISPSSFGASKGLRPLVSMNS